MSHTLRQSPAQNLAYLVAWQRIHKIDGRTDPKWVDPAGEISNDICTIVLLLSNHRQAKCLPIPGMTGRKRRDFTNAFCNAQACLDFTDGNTHSSHFEEIGYSTFDPNKTILIHVAYVTRQQGTINKALRSTIYIIPVTRRHRGTAHSKLTRPPSRERLEIGADGIHFQVVDGHSCAA